VHASRALSEKIQITHQRRLPCTLNTIQSEEEWRGICAFFLVIVMMCLDLVEDERDAVLRLVVNYLDSHLSISLQVCVRVKMVVVEEEDNMSTADKDKTGDDVLALME
jgi:hypothetical protein